MKKAVFSGIVILCFILLHGLAFADSQCNIIKNSLYSGSSLQATVANALRAGVSPDVVSRCAIDAGASSQEVTRVIGNVNPLQITSADSSDQQRGNQQVASPFVPPGHGGTPPGQQKPK